MDLQTQRLMMAAAGAAGGKTYVDDVFSSYVYAGNATAQGTVHQIVNGVDNTEGGLVWIKNRTYAQSHTLLDTVRVSGAGNTAELYSDKSDAQTGPYSGYNITAFNNNGFKLEGNGTGTNRSGDDYVSWNFRKAEGFFDIVTYTGNGTAGRTVSHNLGCVPGMIIVKATDSIKNWCVYHQSLTATHNVLLDVSNAATDVNTVWNDTEPTSTNFTVGVSGGTNENGTNYIAYLFAGDNSDSVHFDGSGDSIRSGTGNAFTHGTNDFTIECWAKFEDTSNSRGVYQHNGLITQNFGTTPAVGHDGNDWVVYGNGGSNYYTGGGGRTAGQWYHLAHVRNSGTTKLYVDGVEKVSFTDTFSYGTTRILIGGYYNSSYLMKGNVTNWRLVKGRALYTSNFTPPTSPLGKTYDGDGNMDTFFLCCNTGDPAGYTIDDTGNGLSVYGGDPQQSADVPSTFTAASSVFGENEDQEVIKCGSYVGNGSSTGPEINLGWEPQWILLKNVTANNRNWKILDVIRGIPTGSYSNDKALRPDENTTEDSESVLDVTPTGFKITAGNAHYNENGEKIIFCAIRRPDGYVGKPATAGTDVFAMDTGNGSSTIPVFDSGFPVDFALSRKPASTFNTDALSRLTGTAYLSTNSSSAEGTASAFTWDSNVGWSKDSGSDSDFQSWMWKRHAGFDVVTYKGNGSARQISHSLSKAPEMIWIKCRDNTFNWKVYHKGANGGTNPEEYYFRLNHVDAQATSSTMWNDTAPTSTVFTVGSAGGVNNNNNDFIAMLFASVDGISKVGYYDGSSTSSAQTITTGFQPRFLMIKRINASGPWLNVDTTRGWVNGDDKVNYFNSTVASEEYNMGYPISTGFVLDVDASFNMANNKYIYYAHS